VQFGDEREALDQIKTDFRIDAVITSAELKYTSGVELCWETRLIATSRRPICVLMMSSQYDHRSLIEALDSGADDFIGKPPLAEELYARLRAAERIASMQRELIRLATIDPLLSAIVLDIDNFKQINDSYGHETGDEAICACARAAFLNDAVVGRLGRDEFCASLKGSHSSSSARGCRARADKGF
jgi:two-component system cell cycle response regulator